ncbi:MAG: hypothetical protein M1837_005877 [Sclerophora amabilis]|nr:MAG: hypothetical protein M1837_005877 [Sclerophora amabilis]
MVRPSTEVLSATAAVLSHHYSSLANGSGADNEIADSDETSDAGSDRVQRPRERSSTHGSGARRSTRGRKPRELPLVEIPSWFLDRNVRLLEELERSSQLLGISSDPGPSQNTKSKEQDVPRKGPDATKETEKGSEPDSESSLSPTYQLQQGVWDEILAAFRSGLSLPAPRFSDAFPGYKAHVLLQCPYDGGIYFLDSIVTKAASVLGADVVHLDAQDVAEIGGDYLGEIPGLSSVRQEIPTLHSARSLSYDVYQESRPIVLRAFIEAPEERQEQEEEEEDAEEEDENEADSAHNTFSSINPSRSARIGAFPVSAFADRLRGAMANVMSGSSPMSDGSGRNKAGPQVDLAAWDERKLNSVLSCLCGARQIKWGITNLTNSRDGSKSQLPESGLKDEIQNTKESEIVRPLIITIRDFKEIQATPLGGKILWLINVLIWSRRKLGQEILVVGTTSSTSLAPPPMKTAIKQFQAEHEDGYGRTILVPPHHSADQQNTFVEDKQRRIREINMRNLRDVIRRRKSDSTDISAIASENDPRLDSSQEFAFGLGSAVWPFGRVHRVATTALGLLKSGEALSLEIIGNALQLLDASDGTKFDWAAREKPQGRAEDESLNENDDLSRAERLRERPKGSDKKPKRETRNYNRHEKKLVGGVIDADSIQTTFAHVQAPPENIEALKTLTTLSLVRPDAFKYGVLANDKIPGLLLYGPPGTGKTLLAKAVAKESGASVLEVSGSDIYDMYVGEGEKNVKAIFTLAKKLSPCVVFIDEADAIFGSRSGNVNRTSHRELINQFLREWDGMDDLSAFLMVATNRPFDLDDAVLRRLPRRLLVDLPTEDDRKAILEIHLQGEALESSVSLSDLAGKTPFYSGSDLKNVAVAAALACVREENEEAAKHASNPESYRYPEKRVLTNHHFEKALEEISASISEDMSSLTAIRKFDERYGDRRGRKKKRSGWGFGNVSAEEQKLETGRVRN